VREKGGREGKYDGRRGCDGRKEGRRGGQTWKTGWKRLRL